MGKYRLPSRCSCRERRIEVASAQATATEGENLSKIKVAQSDAQRREQEAEAERLAVAAEKVKSAQASQEAYAAETTAEKARAEREKASQHADIIIPAEIEKLKNLDILVVNALRIEPHISHFNLSEALNFIKLVNPKKAYLTHISHHLGFHNIVEKTLPENVEIAYDQLQIFI